MCELFFCARGFLLRTPTSMDETCVISPMIPHSDALLLHVEHILLPDVNFKDYQRKVEFLSSYFPTLFLCSAA